MPLLYFFGALVLAPIVIILAAFAFLFKVAIVEPYYYGYSELLIAIPAIFGLFFISALVSRLKKKNTFFRKTTTLFFYATIVSVGALIFTITFSIPSLEEKLYGETAKTDIWKQVERATKTEIPKKFELDREYEIFDLTGIRPDTPMGRFKARAWSERLRQQFDNPQGGFKFLLECITEEGMIKNASKCKSNDAIKTHFGIDFVELVLKQSAGKVGLQKSIMASADITRIPGYEKDHIQQFMQTLTPISCQLSRLCLQLQKNEVQPFSGIAEVSEDELAFMKAYDDVLVKILCQRKVPGYRRCNESTQ